MMNGRGWERAAQAEGTAEKKALRGQHGPGTARDPKTGFGRQLLVPTPHSPVLFYISTNLP